MIDVAQCAAGGEPANISELAAQVESDGGAVLARYRDPFGARWQLLCALPVARVEPAPFQRDLNDSHVARMSGVIERIERYLDPVIAVRAENGVYWVPNGYHRLEAMRRLRARAIVAIVVPDIALAYQILALNTERAPGTREKSLQAVRLVRLLSKSERLPESEFAPELEQPYFVTLGLCYERRPKIPASAYLPLLRRVDGFLDDELPQALELRGARADKLLALDSAVAAVVDALRERGFDTSVRPLVVARANPLHGSRRRDADYDETLDATLAACEALDVDALAAELAEVGAAT